MKRIIAAITTLAVAVGLAAVGVTSAALATGSNDPVPYTVTATSLTLPSGDVFSAAGFNDGNVKYIPSSQYVAGQTYTNPGSNWTVTNVNFHLENKAGYGAGVEGASTLPFSVQGSDGAFKADLPTTGYCIVWVQVGGFNEHFGEGGQAPICSATTAQYASAATTIIAATCQVGQTLDLSAVDHATFGSVTYGSTQGDGSRTYSVTATADSGYTFTSTGTNTLTITGTLAGPSTTGCSTTPNCVSSPTWAYTFTSATASGVITVTKAGAHDGDVLCQPLYVRSTTWTYDLPTNGTPSWPQTFDAKQDLTISTISSTGFSYAAPDVTNTCQQHDIYATFSANGFGALTIPTHLLGPNNPYEPAFLHATLSGKGPTPTYTNDSDSGCTQITPVATLAGGVCYWDAGQQGSFKTAALTYDNSASNVPVEFDVTGYPAYTRTVPAKSVVTISLAAAYSGGVNYTVTAGGKTFQVGIGAYAPCPPTVQTCTTTSGPVLSTNLAPNGWSFTDTRANGHNVYVSGALHIYTDGSTDVDSSNVNTDLAAGKFIPSGSIALSAFGYPTMSYSSASGSLPTIRIAIDKDGDGGADGYLVYQAGAGSNPSSLTTTSTGKWWATKDLGVNDSSAPDPSYQKSWGTLNEFLATYPNARITSIGYALGSNAKGDGVISGITAGCQNFTFNQVNAPTVAPAPVTFQDVCGKSSDGVFIPTPGASDHYSYTTVDNRDANGVGTVTVTAVPDANFAFPAGTVVSWSHTFQSDSDLHCTDIAGDPTAHNPVCNGVDGTITSGYITVVASTGITYTIHDIADGASTAHDISVTGGKTNLPAGSYAVTAAAIAPYVLSHAISPFTPLVIGSNPTGCLPTLALITPSVTAISPSCSTGSAGGYLLIDPNDGLNYFIGATRLTAAKTPMAPGTYSVLAVPVDPKDGVDTNVVPNPMSVVIQRLGTSCAQLTTLAFTGGAGPSGFLIASAVLLLLGGALIFTRKPRSPRHTA